MKPSLIAQIYGYAVCLVSVVVFLIALTGMVEAMFDLGEPLSGRARYAGPERISSFEVYRRDFQTSRAMPRGPGEPAVEMPDDSTLRAIYEAERADRIGSARFEATRSLVRSALLMLAAVLLFITHWRWMTRLREADGS